MNEDESRIASLCRRLANTLEDDDGRGMAAWSEVRARLAHELYAELGQVVGPSPDALDAAYKRGYDEGYTEGYSNGHGEGYDYASDDGS